MESNLNKPEIALTNNKVADEDKKSNEDSDNNTNEPADFVVNAPSTDEKKKNKLG